MADRPGTGLGPLSPWMVALGLSLGPAVSNGLARFAYGLLLPAMREDLGWSYAQAGWLNTANALGYLAGAVLAFMLIDRLGARRLFVLGMIALPVCLAGSAMLADLLWQSAFRIAAGLAGAATFIAGGVMASALFRNDPSRNALAISLYFGGGGLGMLASGAGLPLLLDRTGPAGWPQAWLIMAALAFVSLVPALLAARHGEDGKGPSLAGQTPLPLRRMALLVLGYFLFAVGYLIYLTFLVALMQAHTAGPALVATAWSLMGLAVIAAPFLWRPLLARSNGGAPLALACCATGAATLLPVLWPAAATATVLSATAFGLAFFIAPTAVTHFARRNLAERDWGRAVALFTIVFAAGQTLGPTLAGALADATGSLASGMAAAGITLLLAGLVAALQRPLAAMAPASEGGSSSAPARSGAKARHTM